MAISVLDVRDTLVPPRVRPVRRAAVPPDATARRPSAAPPPAPRPRGSGASSRGWDRRRRADRASPALLSSAHRPSGPVLAIGLVVLAAWVVLAAAGGAAVLDARGRRLLMVVSYAELGLVVGSCWSRATITSVFDRLPARLPLPALALLALAVPVGQAAAGQRGVDVGVGGAGPPGPRAAGPTRWPHTGCCAPSPSVSSRSAWPPPRSWSRSPGATAAPAPASASSH